MLAVRLAVAGRAGGLLVFKGRGGRRIAADANDGMRLRKFNDDDRANAGS